MGTEIGDLGWEAVGASDSTVMILTCPECATSYFVDDSRIAGAGRTVKCSNCGARWTARPEGAEPAPAPAPKPRPAPEPAAAPQPVDEVVFEGPPIATPLKTGRKSKPKATASGREANGKVLVWGASALVIVALIAGLIVLRAQVVQLLPASQKAYAGLGLPVSSLTIEKVRAEPAFQGGRPVLSVSGQLHNVQAAPAEAPALRVSLLDRLGKPVAVKVARPIDTAVPGHATRYFAITMVDPPASVHDLQVTFEPTAKDAAPAAAAAAPPAAKPEPAK
jgi:predicted Zn finger-like uncharacterized protein